MSPGFFLREVALPAGSLAGSGLARLEISATAPEGSAIETAIEQFDLQDAGSLMWGYDEGWHEAEYNPRTGLWRWTSERSVIRVVNPSRPVAVRLQIESPLRTFDAAPLVKITAADRVLAEARPGGAAILEAIVPLDVLRAAIGRIAIETDRVFVPAEHGDSPDRRHLGLRVFGASVVDPN